MISLTPNHESIWKASDGELDLFYDKQDEYVDAMALCQRIRCRANVFQQWRTTTTAIALTRELEKRDIEPCKYLSRGNGINNTFIHPTLVPHLATWLDLKINYQVCKLLQAITIDATIKVVPGRRCKTAKPATTTHSFTFYSAPDSWSKMLKYYAMECATKDIDKRTRVFRENNPHAAIIFQQHEIANSVHVMRAIKKDWKQWENIVVGRGNYCGTGLDKVEICNFLRDMCSRPHTQPTVWSAYDVVDGYEQV
jgi:hypothetical protein